MAKGVSVAPRLFNDDDVRAQLDAGTAVRAIRAAILAHYEGTLQAPARVRASLGDGHLVFTAGYLREKGLFGFRAYATHGEAEQLVAVWSDEDGELLALVHGVELGVRRTGAIGAVAVDAAARPGAVRAGIVGVGPQAWSQLWALCSVRQVEEVVVVARRRERGAAFARRASDELGVRARAVVAVEDAVRERDVVIVATNSTVPVLESDWIAPGTHVTTLGPKTVSRHEVPAELARRAQVILTDSRVQAASYSEPHLFAVDQMIDLGAVLAGAEPGRTAPDQITVFCSVGLAGTEVALAAALSKTST
ncbi:ornithine cyclodeaminase family protein [Streptomyces sp. NBC_00038]|uniref:ornithine cyclodeaminase family protein n=1 Tax=Streptomyces sp. NBC_00038 TaxID=2903615 RepID=UPI00224ED5E2|nr:ornithine cyclodeaminase family protein [Streptomyces sp. NBC_00038]MCX5554836.1 ornithine cyclodeaminase family protein [Streptomyces sp. NBC_00038]